MPSTPFQPQGIVAEALSDAARVGATLERPMRLHPRGEQFTLNLFNDTKTLLMEGSYYVASTPTPATGIALSVATGTTFADTQALVGINNTSLVSAPVTLYLDFIAFVVTTAPTAATSHDIAHRIDTGLRSSGGTVVNPVNANMNYANGSLGRVFANPTVVAATGNVRHLGHATIRKAAAPAYIVGDLVVVKFGGVEWSNALANFTLTTQTAIVIPAPPIAIGPQQSYVMNEWAAARSAALSGELFVGYVER